MNLDWKYFIFVVKKFEIQNREGISANQNNGENHVEETHQKIQWIMNKNSILKYQSYKLFHISILYSMFFKIYAEKYDFWKFDL